MSRKDFLTAKHLTLEELALKYKELETIEAVAKFYGASERTVRKYLTLGGVRTKRGPKPSLQLGARSECGCLAKWLRDHPTQSLPHSVCKISQLTGCSQDEVKSYLYRKRSRMQELLHRVPDLRSAKNLLLSTVQGYRVPTRAFSAYKLYLNKWTFSVKIKAWLKPRNNQVLIEMPLLDLCSKLSIEPCPGVVPACTEPRSQ